MNAIRIITLWGLLLTLILLPSGCGNQQMAAVLDGVEACMQSRPDSALAVLRTMDTSSLDSRRLQARYALLHAMALDKNWIDTTDIGVVMPAVRYYDRRRSVANRAKPYYYLGRIQYNGGHYDEAVISFTRAKEYARKMDDDRFKALVFQAMGDTYNMAYLFEEAYALSDSAYIYSLKAGDTLLSYAALYRKAQNLNNLKRYHEAVSVYESLIEDPLAKTNQSLYSRILSGGALAVINDTDNYERAKELYEKCLAYGGRFDNYSHWGAYAYCLFRSGNNIKADSIFQQLEKAGFGDQYPFQVWKSRVNRLLGNLPAAYDLLEKSTERQTSRTREILSQSVVKAQRDYFDMQTRFLQEKETRRVTTGWTIVLLSLISIICVWQISRKRVELAREEKEMLLHTVKRLTEHLNEIETTSQLKEEQSFTRYVQLFHTYLQQMGTIQDMLRNSRTEEGTYQLINKLKKQVQKLSLDKAKQREFEAMLNQELNGAMIHYREAFPGQSEQEYRFISFLFAGFDVPTICALVGDKSKQAVYSKKSKLKKKIAKGDSPYKEQFLQILY